MRQRGNVFSVFKDLTVEWDIYKSIFYDPDKGFLVSFLICFLTLIPFPILFPPPTPNHQNPNLLPRLRINLKLQKAPYQSPPPQHPTSHLSLPPSTPPPTHPLFLGSLPIHLPPLQPPRHLPLEPGSNNPRPGFLESRLGLRGRFRQGIAAAPT